MDYKIRVASEAESKEAQGLFFELGYKWFSGGNQVQHLKQSCSSSFGYLVAWSNGCFTNVIQCGCGDEDVKEITLGELRDLVVLKRNNVEDATHENIVTGSKVLQMGNKNYYWQDGKWNEYPCGVDIKPIEKPMKEYLTKNSSGEYQLVNHRFSEDDIEVPEGATAARLCEDVEFYKNDFGVFFSRTSDNWLNTISPRGVLMENIVWQRPAHPEQLPFVDDEPNIKTATGLDLDKIAEENNCRFRYNGESDEDYRYQLQHYLSASSDDKPKTKIGELYVDLKVNVDVDIASSPFDTQVGGNHYKSLAIQPMQYALENKLDYAQSNVVKYVTRHASKGGKEDLLKAIHNIELMIEHYYS